MWSGVMIRMLSRRLRIARFAGGEVAEVDAMSSGSESSGMTCSEFGLRERIAAERLRLDDILSLEKTVQLVSMKSRVKEKVH